MIGGKPEAVEICEPILKLLSVEGGYLHCGDSGSGHFVKLVHNGIEFGMLQSIGEGFELLQNGGFSLNLGDVLRVWSNGSVIRGWLVELMEKGLRENPDIKKVPDYVEDTGEVMMILLIFMALLGGIIVYVIFNRYVNSQKQQIGVLLGLGYTRKDILKYFLFNVFVISVISPSSGIMTP